MKRWFMASALLLVSAGLASAEYVVIVANIGAERRVRTQTGRGMAGGRGGMPGGFAGGQPPGMPGMRPGMGGGPGMGGAAGMAGGPGMGGAAGMQGMRPGMGGMAGMAGGPGTGGMPGMPGGRGMGGMAGMRGGMGGMPGMRGGAANLEIDDIPEFVIAIVELHPANKSTDIHKKLSDTSQEEFPSVRVTHKWGKSTLLAKTPFAKTFVLTNDSDNKPLKSVSDRFDKKFKAKITENKSQLNAKDILDLADWALEHGLVNKFSQVMEKLIEIDKTNPAAVAYLKVKGDLNRKAKDEEDNWRSKLLNGYKTDDSEHYSIVHNSSDTKSQKELLENSIRGFYYWFALRGVALPVPIHRQLAVVTSQPNDFQHLHKILTSGPVVVDGFFARRENVAVMASQRQDETYDSLQKFWRRWQDRDYKAAPLFSAKPNAGAPSNTSKDDIHVAQMVALMVKALEQEAELATISHDASRQLLVASGLLPPNVAAPEWLLFGMGSFFETPLRSPWAGIGAPSAYYLPYWKELKSKGLETKSGGTLRKVITDAYFRNLPPQGKANSPERHAYEAALRKARTTSWALTYFLAKQKLDGLQLYFKELSKMPRDLELDEAALLGCFERAFGKKDLESEWFSFMNKVKFESESTMKNIRKIFQEQLEKAQSHADGGPGQNDPRTRPFQPGGFGPGMNPQRPPGPGGFQQPGGFGPPGR